MSIASFAQWLAHTDWAENLSGSPTAFPVILATHLTCIAIFGGLILLTDLRLLGWILPGVSVSHFVQKLRPIKWVGFLIMVSCGASLAGSEANKYYINPYFWMKISLLVLIGIHSLVFRRAVYANTAELDRAAVMPPVAKLAGGLSIALWIGVVCAGRWIGYYEPPYEHVAHPAAAAAPAPPAFPPQ